MTQESVSHSAATLQPGEYSKFMLRTPVEVLVVLRGLYDHVSQITAFFNEGRDMLITTLAKVTDNQLILDFGPSGEINRRALDAEKLFCVTTLDKVRIQFILRGLDKIEHEGREAFRAALPDEVLRLQRREYFRLVTPIARPLLCTMPVSLPNGDTYIHNAHVLDISGGGIGISTPPEGIPFESDMELPNCRIELPEVGFITATIKVRSVFEITLRSGTRIKRAGCEFVKLPGPMATLIQRYIIKVERERKARESGLG